MVTKNKNKFRENVLTKKFLAKVGLVIVLFSQFLFALNVQAQGIQNPIKLGVVAVTKDGERQSTTAVNQNRYTFDGVLNDSDSIRYQWEGVDLALKYKNLSTSEGGYLQVYAGTVSSDNFILDTGRENYPLKVSDLSSKLKPGENTLQFVYKNSANNQTYSPVSFTFNYQEDVDGPKIEVLKPGSGSVFMPDLENEINLKLENFRLSAQEEVQEGVGKLKVYYSSINQSNLLGTVTNSTQLSATQEQVVIEKDQLDYNKIPDSNQTKLIFALVNAEDQSLGVNQEVVIQTNFQNTLNIGLPQIQILEPQKERTDLTVDEDTKFILQIENFEILSEVQSIEDQTSNPNQGYLQILITENGIEWPIQSIWPKSEFTLKEIGYGLNDPETDQSGNKKIKVQLVDTNFELLEPEAEDQIDIFFKPEVVSSKEDENVIQNSVWRIVIITITVILIVGVIVILVIKG